MKKKRGKKNKMYLHLFVQRKKIYKEDSLTSIHIYITFLLSMIIVFIEMHYCPLNDY